MAIEAVPRVSGVVSIARIIVKTIVTIVVVVVKSIVIVVAGVGKIQRGIVGRVDQGIVLIGREYVATTAVVIGMVIV